MLCQINRESRKKRNRSYHTNFAISKRTYNKIIKLPGVAEVLFLSGYEIYEINVSIGQAFDWDPSIDQRIIQILQKGFKPKRKLGSRKTIEYVVTNVISPSNLLGSIYRIITGG